MKRRGSESSHDGADEGKSALGARREDEYELGSNPQNLFTEHTILRISPAEANRAEAAGLAWANEVANGNSQMATQHLLVRQMDRALRSLATLPGEFWEGAPPDPTEELVPSA